MRSARRERYITNIPLFKLTKQELSGVQGMSGLIQIKNLIVLNSRNKIFQVLTKTMLHMITDE